MNIPDQLAFGCLQARFAVEPQFLALRPDELKKGKVAP